MDINELKRRVAEYAKNNRWMSRKDVIKGLKDSKDKYPFPDAEIEDAVNTTLWPGEKRKGNVHFTESTRGDTYYRVGREYPQYSVEPFGDSLADTFRVVQYDETTGRIGRFRRANDSDVKVLVKNVPKRWAQSYVLNKVDSSLPKPKKLEGRELMRFGKTKAKVVTSMDSLLSEGVPAKGFVPSDLESRPVLLFKGADNGIVTDGFLLVRDKKVANDVLEKHISHLWKGHYNLLRKGGSSDEEAKDGADKYIKEQRKGDFPKWENLVPEPKMEGWEPVGTSITDAGDQVAWLFHPSGKWIAVNVDKLAFIYKSVPNISSIRTGEFSPITTGSWGGGEKTSVHSSVLSFYDKDGELKALLMPMYCPIVPEKILEASVISVKVPVAKTRELYDKNKYDYLEKEKDTDLQSIHAIHGSRSELSRISDERQSNLDTIDADSPRIKTWKRNPGSMDVRGVDTTRGKVKYAVRARKSAKGGKGKATELGQTRS